MNDITQLRDGAGNVITTTMNKVEPLVANVEVPDTSKHINIRLPLQTNRGQTVNIISCEGRTEGYPIVGYIADDTAITEWSLEGIDRHNYGSDRNNLKVAPKIGEVWLTIYDYEGDTIFLDQKLQHCQTMDGRTNRQPAARVKVAFVIEHGQRDDLEKAE